MSDEKIDIIQTGKLMWTFRLLTIIFVFSICRETLAGPVKAKMATSKNGMVIACEPLAAEAGISILRRGGNAADAYIAVTLAEYVLAWGYTSLSGPLYLLYHDIKTHKSAYLNAGLNTVSDPAGQWNKKEKIPGTSYVIGGAGRGLESLFQRYKSGRFSLTDLAAPAIKLARDGFILRPDFARAIQRRQSILSTSSAWTSRFVKNGKPLATGEKLLQPELADTLSKFSLEGADYLYKGKFAENLVHMIRANGGKLTLEDMSSYQVYWNDPLEITYRNFKVQSSSYRSFGGLDLLLSLKALENFKDLRNRPHYSKDEGLFETILRTHLFSLQKMFPISRFSNRLETLSEMQSLLSGPIPSQLWKEITNLNIPAPMSSTEGTHSCNPVVVDRVGNIATGVHTIDTQPWGDFGFFVGGVSLNTAYPTVMDAPPGVRALDSINPMLVFKNEKPIIAAGFFAQGLSQAAPQIAVNLMDYDMSPKEALESPRFGYITDYGRLSMFLDPRYPKQWVDNFAKKGIRFSQPSGYVATGMGMIIRIDPQTGIRQGSPTELAPEAVVMTE